MVAVTVMDRRAYKLALAPDRSCWAAVNDEAARLIQDLATYGEPKLDTWIRSLVSRDSLTPTQAEEIVRGCAGETSLLWNSQLNETYQGRGAYLRPVHLRELWLHINNRCNFACRHCLVSSGPDRDDGLPSETVASLIKEARELGVVTFFFTGGEPLLRPDLPELLGLILADPQAHAVVLTNGSLIGESFIGTVADLDRDRLHLQISLDGSTPELNDSLRSPQASERTTAGIRQALAAGINTTVATVVLKANLHDLPAMAQLLSRLGVNSWHLMWQHLRERGAVEPVADIDSITDAVLALAPIAAQAGVRIDNFENFKAVINGEPGTKRDGTNACWDSLAVYTDGGVYPSASLVGVRELLADNILDRPLRDIWLRSPAFETYRQRSAVSSSSLSEDPFLFLHGGGDPEHAHFFGNGKPDAVDPYVSLYRAMMLYVADQIVAERMALIGARDDVPLVYHVMGQDGLGCPVDAGVENTSDHRIDFLHSNCVLMQDVIGHSRQIVQDFYAEAAATTQTEICCPVPPADQRYSEHIPEIVLERSYGCGSPVSAAHVLEGETVVDLGSGGGIECFIAAKMVGADGLVIGVDMTPEMIELANWGRGEVADALGYDNVRFVEGYLESIPLEASMVDVVISNCVINLSPEKFKVFSEILRILKPGGRMVISDIVAGDVLPDNVKFNPRLKGECIAGAVCHDELLYLLTKVGFANIQVLAQRPWREVGGVQFFADTVVATKPLPGERPLPYAGIKEAEKKIPKPSEERHLGDCMVCGAPLQYLQSAIETECALCGGLIRTHARCAEGHVVCDQCHGGDYLQFLHSYLAQYAGTDPVEVFLQMRDSYPFPVHGPEHHALVPAAFLAAYRNLHGYPEWDRVWDAIQTGAGLAGGSCAFWGACSAVLGIGVAYGVILEATPLTGKERCSVQEVVSRVLGRVATLDAPRCCRRESLISLLVACELSTEFLPHSITTDYEVECDQVWANKECIGPACPFFPISEGQDEVQCCCCDC